MNRFKSSAVCFAIGFILLNSIFMPQSFSTSTPNSAPSNAEIKIFLNSSPLQFGTNSNDPLPYIKEGRTLVPFRKIFEALGMEITWNDAARSVLATNDTTEMEIFIGKNIAYVNDEEKGLDVPAEITDSRTFVPLRFVSENCGAKVDWDGKTRTIAITMPPKEIVLEDTPVPAAPPEVEVKEYKMGQEITYKDLKFTVDRIEDDTKEEKMTATGTINSKEANIVVDFYDDVGYFLSGRLFVGEPAESGKYNFKIFVPYRFTFEPKYAVVNIINEENEKEIVGYFVLKIDKK